MKVFSLNKTELSKSIFDILDVSNSDNELRIEKFLDGEFCPIFTKSIRSESVYIIADGYKSDDLIKLFLTIDAAKRSGSKEITIAIPYLPYSRSDKNDHIRQSISSKALADILSSLGINNLITIDLHSGSIQGFYNIPVIHLNGNKIFTNYIKSLSIPDMVLVAPDSGAIKRVSDFAKDFPDASFALINKKRTKPNEVHSMVLMGDVAGKHAIIIDDLVDTANTLKKAAQLIMESGAKSVRAIATHPVLSGEAYHNIEDSPLIELIVSDTVISKTSPKIKLITCAPLIARSIKSLETKTSIHNLNI